MEKTLPSLPPSPLLSLTPLRGIKSNCSRLDKSIWHGSLNYFNLKRSEGCAGAHARCGHRGGGFANKGEAEMALGGEDRQVSPAAATPR